jgi:hypothetical protein
MDIIEFRKQKYNEENLLLDNNIIELLLEIFDNKIKKPSFKNKHVNILKGVKVQSSKDSIPNKVNLILNKLSENNMNNLMIEFITIINQVDEKEFNEILKTFYLKIVSEINFVNIYLDFLKKIVYLYEKVENYSIKNFINIVEAKFKIDYCNYNNDEYSYLLNMQEEDKRINNLVLIKNLVDNNLLSCKVLEECLVLLLDQNKYIIDIYKWIELTKIKLDDNKMIKVNNILNSENISCRDKILLESLTSNNVLDIFKLECYNIINSNIDNILLFVKEKCKDAITKNKFCNNILLYYLTNNDNYIFSILDNLLENKIILKSNISKGFSLLNKDNDNIKKYLLKL